MTDKATNLTKNGKTLADFGYGFNDEGKLRQLDAEKGTLTDKGFEFAVHKDHHANQRRYEELGEVITEYVYDLLESKGMVKLPVPETAKAGEGTFIYSTSKEFLNAEKLLVLIHGSGVVRAGQWSRSLIINHSIAAGTQLPYIEKARNMGFEVISTNTNDNHRDGKSIRYSEDSVEHAIYVWEKYIMPSNPKSVAIVAHSYGGIVTMELAKKFPEFFQEKVFAIGLTDSVHMGLKGPPALQEYLKSISRNWVGSSKPLDTKLSTEKSNDIPHYSAGHTQHEWTSYSCMSALFDFFTERLDIFTKRQM
uniref:Arb2 domain-containing protein n=1 Tax=Lutzomyia longipalpis TaxID=7200 RepID=A0A1B0GIA4_LUTLO